MKTTLRGKPFNEQCLPWPRNAAGTQAMSHAKRKGVFLDRSRKKNPRALTPIIEVAAYKAERGCNLLETFHHETSGSSRQPGIRERCSTTEQNTLRRWSDAIIAAMFALGGGDERMTAGLMRCVIKDKATEMLLEKFGLRSDAQKESKVNMCDNLER